MPMPSTRLQAFSCRALIAGHPTVLIAALLLEVVAAVLFLAAPALPVLVVARLVTGFGVGMLTATATAHLHDLHTAHRPGGSSQRFEIVSTAANIGGGLGVGPLAAGLLAQYFGAAVTNTAAMVQNPAPYRRADRRSCGTGASAAEAPCAIDDMDMETLRNPVTVGSAAPSPHMLPNRVRRPLLPASGR